MKRSLAPFAGLGFAAALLASTVLTPGGPDSRWAPARIAAYYARHGRGDVVSDYVSLLATALLLVVFGATAARLRDSRGALLLLAAAIGAVFELAATAVELTLAGNHAPATTAAALYQLASRLFFVSTLGIGAGVGLAASGDAGWLRRFGGVTAALLIAAGLSVAHPHGPLSVLLLPGWTLLLGWSVWRSVVALRHDGAVVRSADAVRPARA
jgi:hypothetical protein